MILDRDEVPDERQVARLLRQILDGIAFLHSLNVAHLDIKVSLESRVPEGHRPGSRLGGDVESRSVFSALISRLRKTTKSLDKSSGRLPCLRTTLIEIFPESWKTSRRNRHACASLRQRATIRPISPRIVPRTAERVSRRNRGEKEMGWQRNVDVSDGAGSFSAVGTCSASRSVRTT